MSATRITKEAARDIWQAACNTKSVLTPFDTYERLSYVLQQLSKDVGEDGEPLGQFLVSEGEDEGAKVSGIPTGEKTRKFLVRRGNKLLLVQSFELSGKSNPIPVNLLNLFLLKSLGAGEGDFPGIDTSDDDLHSLLKGQVFLFI